MYTSSIIDQQYLRPNPQIKLSIPDTVFGWIGTKLILARFLLRRLREGCCQRHRNNIKYRYGRVIGTWSRCRCGSLVVLLVLGRCLGRWSRRCWGRLPLLAFFNPNFVFLLLIKTEFRLRAFTAQLKQLLNINLCPSNPQFWFRASLHATQNLHQYFSSLTNSTKLYTSDFCSQSPQFSVQAYFLFSRKFTSGYLVSLCAFSAFF